MREMSTARNARTSTTINALTMLCSIEAIARLATKQ